MSEANHSIPYDHHKGSQPLLAPAHPWRAAIFLTVNIAGFAAANAFWRYLATGQWVDFSLQAYQNDLHMMLGNALQQHPLPVNQHLWMLPVTAGLLAGMIFVPVIVSVLYRMYIAAVFLVIVAVVGHCPVLAAMLAFGCILAAYSPLRSDMPFLAVILGLLPMSMFLLWAFSNVNLAAAAPIKRFLLYAPAFGAGILAILGAAIVLAMAKWTRFRPGVVWPVLVILLAVPFVVFHQADGWARLGHALVARSIAPGDNVFAAQSLDDWQQRKRLTNLPESALVNEIDGDLRTRRLQLVEQCESFLQGHPDYDLAAEVLWIQAQAHSVRFALRQDEASGRFEQTRRQIVYSAAWPLPESADAWRKLCDLQPNAPQAGLAHWRLGELAARDGRFAEAVTELKQAVKELTAAPKRTASDQILASRQLVPSEDYYRLAILEAERLIRLIEQNVLNNDSEDPEARQAAERALKDLLAVDPFTLTRPQRTRRLEQLGKTYDRTPLADNIRLETARINPDVHGRVKTLMELAEAVPATDTNVEACFLLAQLTAPAALLREPGLDLTENLKPQTHYLEEVTRARSNPWQTRAIEMLRQIRQQELSSRPGS